jgi:hypothetical protein
VRDILSMQRVACKKTRQTLHTRAHREEPGVMVTLDLARASIFSAEVR